MQGESEATKLLADLNIGKILVDELLEMETRPERLEIPRQTIKAIKKSII